MELRLINRQLYEKYALRVLECGSLTGAAKALGISQPALTMGLNALEKETGIRIFNRRTNPVTLTDEGGIFMRHLKRLEMLNGSFEKELADYRKAADNRVVIGAPAVYVRSVIAPAIKRMSGECDISIVTASIDQLIQAAESGRIDCFVSTVENLPAAFEVLPVCREEIVLCVPEDSEVESMDFGLLKNEVFICLDAKFPLQQAVDEMFDGSGFTPRRRIRIDQVAEAVNLAEQGLGVCFAPREAAVSRHVKTIPTKLTGRGIYLAYDRDVYRSGACEMLINAIIPNDKDNGGIQ